MHVLISGAGIAGLTLAYCLERAGIHYTVVEKSAAVRAGGYMIDFFGSGYDAAERMGLLPDLQQIHYPIARLVFLNGDGDEKFAIPYPKFRKFFQERHFNFLRGELEHLLYRKLPSRSDFRFGAVIESVQQDDSGVTATLSDRTKVRADVLVGADGIHSNIRAQCFGPESSFCRYLYCNTAAFIIENPPSSFSRSNEFVTMTVPGRQIGLYPIRGGKLATFFVYTSATPPASLSSPVAAHELRERYGQLGWVVPDVLECMDGGIYFDAVEQIAMPTWSSGRVVLLGDAAYCVSLMAGQGASLAMAGGYILAQELNSNGGNIAAGLARYEERMRRTVEEKQRAGRKIVKWFVPEDRLRLEIRDFFLRMVGWPIAEYVLKGVMSPDSVFKGAH